MRKFQYLLNKLAEEGSEVAQIALKTAQFGFFEAMPGQPFNNLERCHQELDDIAAIVEMLNEECGFQYEPSRHRILLKKERVKKYRDYSISLGMVEGEVMPQVHPMTE